MNKNTLLAFLLMLLAVWFFTGEFYYERILNRPHPSEIREKELAERMEEQERRDTAIVEGEAEAEAEDSDTAEQQDTIEVERKAEQRQEEIKEEADTIWVETEALVVGITEK
ncbi:MAG: hypothetical protein GF344_08755, partial [Chitinivibrionales bacterium]|nr:hypothetical protein [Chitinivibrionales bacterium]